MTNPKTAVQNNANINNAKTGLALNQMIVLSAMDITSAYDDLSLAQTTGLTRKQVYWALARLKHRGYLERGTKALWQLSPKGAAAIATDPILRSGPQGPHTGQRQSPKHTLNHYAWQALRAKGTATAEDITGLLPVALAEDDKTLGSVRRLLGWYEKAHLVRKLRHRSQGCHYNSRGHVRYQLLVDLGPKHPIIRQRKHEIFDPNRGRNMKFKEVINRV